MANKKCPKCGEDNPAEAVMCWACYTPLTAGAGAAMNVGAGIGGAGAATMPRAGGPVGVPGADVAPEKKQIDPKLFFVGGGLLLAAVIAMFTTGMIGGSTPSYTESGVAGVDPTPIPWTSPSGGQQQVQPPPPPPPSGNTGGGNTGETGPPPPSFSMIVSPNPQYATAAFAIAPSQPGVSPEQAAGLARTARQQLATNGKWKNTQIAVFTTSDSAQAFRQFMNSRRGAPLSGGDFANLASQNAWASAIVFYESRGNSERVSEPAKNPKGWWGR